MCPYVSEKVSHLLVLVVVSAAAPGAVAGVGVIPGGGGGHHGGGGVSSVLGVAVTIAAAGHRVHHVKHGQPEEQLQHH